MQRRVPSLEKLDALTGFRPNTMLPEIVDRVVAHFEKKRELVASSRAAGSNGN